MSSTNPLLRLFQRIRDIGVPEDMRPEELKYIRLSNLLLLFILFITFAFGFQSLANHHYYQFLFNISTFALLISIYPLQKKGYFLFTKISGLVIFNLYILISATFFTGAMRDETNFIVAGVAILMFPKKETKWMIAMVAFSVGCFYAKEILQNYFVPLYLPTQFLGKLFTVIFCLAFIFIALIGRHSTIHAEELLRENEEKLEASNEQIIGLNRELEQSYYELKELDDMKDHFLSMVSHDLRTPMTSVQGYASILLEKKGRLAEDRERRYLSIIIEESKRLTRLINDLLDLQRFEAGKMNLIYEDLDLSDVVNRAVDAFKGAAMPKNISLESELPESAVMINGDTDRLSQVISNLLSNAIKFTPEEGSVKVNVERISENGKPSVKVSVSDTGEGIPKDKHATLFDKFQQVEQAGQAKQKQKGSGLGLALVREIIEYHEGKVGVESEPDKGSTFYFTLQLKSD